MLTNFLFQSWLITHPNENRIALSWSCSPCVHDPSTLQPNESLGFQRYDSSIKVAFSTQASRFGPEGRHSFKRSVLWVPWRKCKGFGYAEISGKLVQWHMNSRICLVCLRLINLIWPTSNMNAIPCLNLRYPTSSQSGTDNKGLCVSPVDLLGTWPIERELRWRSFEYEHLLVWNLQKSSGFQQVFKLDHFWLEVWHLILHQKWAMEQLISSFTADPWHILVCTCSFSEGNLTYLTETCLNFLMAIGRYFWRPS